MSYPNTNILIESLPEPSKSDLLRRLRNVVLPTQASLYEPEEPPRYVHFLLSGLASIVLTMLDGSTTEVATVGREGMPQSVSLLGPAGLPSRAFMQIGGHALQMEYKAFQEIFANDEQVHRVVLAYVQYHAAFATQIAGCNRLHEAEGRLARWLAIVQDRTGEPTLNLTQEFLAQMIGSRRTTVTDVAGSLQERGVIKYSRGVVHVLDRKGLEKVCCECYPTTRRLLAGLYDMAGETVYRFEDAAVES